GIGHRASGIGHRASFLLVNSDNNCYQEFYSLYKNPFSDLSLYFFYISESNRISLFKAFLRQGIVKTGLCTLFLLVLFTVISIKPVYGLTTQTAQVINGTSPYLTYDNGKTVSTTILPLLSLTLPNNKVISALEDKSSVVEPIVIEKVPTTFNDIKTYLPFSNYPSMPLANVIVANNYWRDADGDKLFTITGYMKVKWETYDGEDVTDYVKSNPNSELDSCKSPYKLTLSADDGALLTNYGIPDTNSFKGESHSYYILSKHTVCYVKPYAIEKMPQFQWLSFDSSNTFVAWNDSRYTSRTAVGGGYTSDYVPNIGFKATPTASGGKKFPTTGFAGAKFQLIVTGSPASYSFSVPNNPGGQVAIDQQGYVLLKGKPTGDVTVRATVKQNPMIKLDYTFNPTSVWANPLKDFFDIWSVAIQRCSINNLLSYSELTNTPVDNRLNGSFEIINGYTRAIGQGLLPEWGYSTQQTYPDSTWRDEGDRYWTKDLYYQSSYGTHIDVNSSSGLLGVDADAVGAPDYLVCRQ
ncbi:hypothetical protein J3U56_11415, partial [Gilliamella sp. B2824]|uniref:hypothetical protein n=1 Tax=Gilliamella sp. B2824 TaxID=2818019 RepID=UPI00226A29A9